MVFPSTRSLGGSLFSLTTDFLAGVSLADDKLELLVALLPLTSSFTCPLLSYFIQILTSTKGALRVLVSVLVLSVFSLGS
jgi:hypothetical protein